MNESAKKTSPSDIEQDQQLHRLIHRALEQDGSLIPVSPEAVLTPDEMRAMVEGFGTPATPAGPACCCTNGSDLAYQVLPVDEMCAMALSEKLESTQRELESCKHENELLKARIRILV